MDVCRCCLEDFQQEDSSALGFYDDSLKKFLSPVHFTWLPSYSRPPFCGSCIKSLQEAVLLVFKASITEAKLIEAAKGDDSVVIDIKKFHAKVDALPSDLRTNVEVCRLCLQFIAKPKIFLCENNHNILPHTIIKDMLEFCNIRMEYDISEKPTMCSECWELLQIAYTFKKNYVEIIKKLQHFSPSYNVNQLKQTYTYWNKFRQFLKETNNNFLNKSVPKVKKGVLDVNHDVRIKREHDYMSGNPNLKHLPTNIRIVKKKARSIIRRKRRKLAKKKTVRVFSAEEDVTILTIYLLVTENETKFWNGVWIKISDIWRTMHPGKGLSYSALKTRTTQILKNKSISQSEINRIKNEVLKELETTKSKVTKPISNTEVETMSQSNETPLLNANGQFEEIKNSSQNTGTLAVTSVTAAKLTDNCFTSESALPVLSAKNPFLRKVNDDFQKTGTVPVTSITGNEYWKSDLCKKRSVTVQTISNKSDLCEKRSATSASLNPERTNKLQKGYIDNEKAISEMPTSNAKYRFVQAENKVVQPSTSTIKILSNDILTPVMGPGVKSKRPENNIKITPGTSALTAPQKHIQVNLTNLLIKPSIPHDGTAFRNNKDCTPQQQSEILVKNGSSIQLRQIGMNVILNENKKNEIKVPLDNTFSVAQQKTNGEKDKQIKYLELESIEKRSHSSLSSAGSNNAVIDQIPPLVSISRSLQSNPGTKSLTTDNSFFRPVNVYGNDSGDTCLEEGKNSFYVAQQTTNGKKDNQIKYLVLESTKAITCSSSSAGSSNAIIDQTPPLISITRSLLRNPGTKSLTTDTSLLHQVNVDGNDSGDTYMEEGKNSLSVAQQRTNKKKDKQIKPLVLESIEERTCSSLSSAGSSNAIIDQIPPLIGVSRSLPINPGTKSLTTDNSLCHPVNVDGNDSDDTCMEEAAQSNSGSNVKTEPPDDDIVVCVDDENLEVENNQGIWNCRPLLKRMDLPSLKPKKKTVRRLKKSDIMIRCKMDEPDIDVEIIKTCRRFIYNDKPIGDGLFRCLQCSFETKYRGSAFSHSSWHSGKKKLYNCSECSYKIPNKMHMRKHMKLHEEENAARGLLQET